MFQMSVDVVIVTKSVDDVLADTIKGLKTYPFAKVIVVAAKESTRPRWCDFLAVDKGKLGKARNTGVDMSKAEYICMVDEDIVLTPGYVEKLLEYFDDSRVASVGGRLESAIETIYALTKAQVFRGYCKTNSDVPCGGTVYKTTLLKKERFNDDLSGGEDHELHARLKRKGFRIVYTEKASCIHHFKGNIKNEIFLCMLSGARTGFVPCLLRAVASPIRSLVLATACRDNLYSMLIPPFYVTQWVAHVFGAFFTEQEIRAKMKALS